MGMSFYEKLFRATMKFLPATEGDRTMLFYSGGKDSLALLLLLQGYWRSDNFEVVWVDTGNQFPEVYEHMEKVKSLVKRFTVLHSDTAKWQEVNGSPVDAVPTSMDAMGVQIYKRGEVIKPYVSRWSCCNANVWAPMAAYMALTKPRYVLRGDRKQERAMGPSEEDGVKFIFPLEDWATEDVRKYIATHGPKFGLLQERHSLPEGSSLDCVTCTAYNRDYKCRMEYLKKHHPDIYEANKRFFEQYKKDLYNEVKELM